MSRVMCVSAAYAVPYATFRDNPVEQPLPELGALPIDAAGPKAPAPPIPKPLDTSDWQPS